MEKVSMREIMKKFLNFLQSRYGILFAAMGIAIGCFLIQEHIPQSATFGDEKIYFNLIKTFQHGTTLFDLESFLVQRKFPPYVTFLILKQLTIPI